MFGPHCTDLIVGRLASFPVRIQNVELGHKAKAPPPLVKELSGRLP